LSTARSEFFLKKKSNKKKTKNSSSFLLEKKKKKKTRRPHPSMFPFLLGVGDLHHWLLPVAVALAAVVVAGFVLRPGVEKRDDEQQTDEPRRQAQDGGASARKPGENESPKSSTSPAHRAGDSAGCGIHKAGWTRLRVHSVVPLTQTTFRLRITLFPPSTVLDLPAGQHLHLGLPKALPAGSPAELQPALVSHPYTPVSRGPGTVDVVFRRYPEGRLTPRLAALQPGAIISVRGPTGQFRYEPGTWDEMCMVAGGTGLTPILALAVEALDGTPASRGPGAPAALRPPPHPLPAITIIYCSTRADDVMCRPELDALAARHPDNLRVIYVASTVPEGTAWPGVVGRMSPQLAVEHLGIRQGGASERQHAFICGPPGFVKISRDALAATGFQGKERVTAF
jgi:cytochrome-b5 reductase